VLVALAVAACGGSSGGSTAAAKQLLSETFSTASLQKVKSGELALNIDAKLNGLSALGGQPVSIVMDGPFSDSGSSPAFDFDATVTVRGETIPLGLVDAHGAIYLKLLGTYYKLPVSDSSAQGQGSSGADKNLLSSLGIHPLAWLTDPKIVGTATVAGVATQHVSAQVDVSRLLSDAGKIAGNLSGIAGQEASSALSPATLSQVGSAITSASVDVYSGSSDHILRELRLDVAFTVPAGDRSGLDGLTGGSLDIQATLSALNSPETITAPATSEPFSDLLGGGGLGSL